MKLFKSTLLLSLVLISCGVSYAQKTTPSYFDISQAKTKDLQGRQYLKEYRFSKAISSYSEAAKLDGKSIYYQHRADAYLEYDKLSKSSADYHQAIRLDSTNGLAYLGVANCLMITDPESDTLEYYLNNALHNCTKNSELAIAMTTMAQLKVSEGNFEIAEDYIVSANKLDPENVACRELYASIEFELDQQERAIELLEEIVKENKNNVRYIVNLSYLYNQMERYDDAIKLLGRAQRYEEDNPYVLANKGYSLLKKGRLSEAKEVITRSLKNDQTNAYGHYVKGLIEIENRNVPKACKCLNRAVDRSFFHDDRSYKEIEKALDKHCDSKRKI